MMKQKNITTILVSSLIVIFVWMGLSIYRASVANTIGEVLNQQIIPITPAFDQAALDKLQDRQQIEPVYTLGGNVASKAATVQVSPTPPAPTASSPQAIPTSPASSESGTLLIPQVTQ